MKKALIPLAVLILFVGFTGYSMLNADESLLAFGARLMSSLDTAQVVIDLYILCVMACVWMYRDHKSRGGDIISLVPYLLLTAVFASVGPLLYLVVSGFKKDNRAEKI